MATYLTGQPLFLPSVQPYQPNFQLYAGALQMKQTQYDANRKKISNLYGSLLNAPLTRETNAQARDEFFKTIDYEIQKLAGVDLSLQENVDTAAKLFTSIYDNKNIVKDMMWTKNFQSEMEAAESFRNCVDPAKCGGQYWDGGVQALEYKRQEFRNASDEQAMGYGDVKYTPYVNVQEKAAKIFKEMGWNYKPMPTMDGAWIIQTKNGEPIVGPLYAHLSAVLGQDPQIKDYYRTKSYLDRKNFGAANAQQYGSAEAAEAAYISEAQKSINETFSQMNREAKQESVTARAKAEDIKRGQEEGFIDKSAEIQAQMDTLFGTADKFDKFDEETSTILTSTAGTAKADLSASGDIIDQNMAALMLNQDLNKAASILAYTDYEVDIKVNEVWKMERQHQMNMELASVKAKKEQEAADEEAMGPPELNELYQSIVEADPNVDPQAAYKQMQRFSRESSDQAKTTNGQVLDKIFQQAQGFANAKGGLNQTQAAEDARLIMERALKQYKGNADYNGTAAQKKQADKWMTEWNKKSKAEQIGWAKQADLNTIIGKMPYMSIHNIIETSIGAKGGNFLEANTYNKANRQYLKSALAQLGNPETGEGALYEYENAYLEAKAWNDVKKNNHATVVKQLDATGPEEFRGKWDMLVNKETGGWKTKNSYAFTYAKDKLSYKKDDVEWMNFEDNKVRVPLGNGKYKDISVEKFFTQNGEVRSQYAWAEKKWKPAAKSKFWDTYEDALLSYSNMTREDYVEKRDSKTNANVEGVFNLLSPGYWIAAMTDEDVSMPFTDKYYNEQWRANKARKEKTIQDLYHSDSKAALDNSEMVRLYREAYNTAPIYKGKQSYVGLKGGGSTVATGLSMFVDYKYHNSQSALLERDFLQNAMGSTFGSEVRFAFGNGKLPDEHNQKAYEYFRTLMSEALMGKKEARPTWVGDYNPVGGGNEGWQQYTITLKDVAMLKQLAGNFSTENEDAVSLYEEIARNGGKVSIYLKDNAANNTLHNMTKKSALERRLDYEGTVPIAYGQYDEGLHNLKLTALPSGYNVSGNIAVGRDENGGFMYDYINQDYFGGSQNPTRINNNFVDILGNINNRLGLRPNIAYPSYGSKQ